MALCFTCAPVYAADPKPVNFDADQLLYDDQAEVVTAIGNVRLEQEGRIVTADSILYKIKEDRVTAVGNVTLTETDGSQYFAEKVQLRDKMRQGYISHLKGVLGDRGRFSAAYAERTQQEGDELILTNATYTTCAPCQIDPDRPPTWQLRAEKVTHDRDEKRVSYDNATFEINGTPVLWTPYFSHPDGTENQKSGLINPLLGYDSELGAYAGASYYYAIDTDKDLTVGLTGYAQEYPVVSTEYRQRFDEAQLEMNGSFTYSNRVIEVGGVNTQLSDELRGNLEAHGLWDITEKWRGGFNVNLTSDDQYLRQYDISDEDILENEVFLERFSGRDYFDARLLSFQDVRLLDQQTDSPNILPEVNLSLLGKPGELIGGRWSLDMQALNLRRDGNDPDTNRISTRLGWQGHRKFANGLVSTLDLGAHGDVYYLTDGVAGDQEETRGYVFANLETAYPLIKSLAKPGSSIVLEPLVSVTGITNVANQDKVTNEDSQDIQVSVNNLFNYDRFSGYDRVEDRSRVTYGLRSTYYSGDNLEIGGFAGQSYNFDDKNNFFPAGSGLRERSSDYVAEMVVQYGDMFDLDYRTRLDRNNLASKSHEVDFQYDSESFMINGLYFFSKAIPGTSLTESREQAILNGRLKVTDNWYLSGGSTYDLGEDPGLRQADAGIEYVGECFSIGTFVERDLTNENSGDAQTKLSVRIGLKNLATFEASGLELFEGEGK